LFRQGRAGFPDKAVVLVGADEQCGTETGKPLFRPVTGGFFQPQAVTKGASAIALVKIGVHTLNKGAQAVFILHDQSHILVPGKTDQGFFSAPVFGKGVNVGVIPEQYRRNPLCPETFHTINRTGGAAAMEEHSHRILIICDIFVIDEGESIKYALWNEDLDKICDRGFFGDAFGFSITRQ
jgi:hypothetical protein